MLFAQRELELNKIQIDNRPLRSHLEAIKKNTGIMPDMLIPIKCPISLEHVWYDYMDIRIGCNERLTYADILAWSTLNKISISPLEIRLLFLLEKAVRDVQ